jgi:hypothetical protein
LSLSGQLSPEMRHCRSCSLLAADGIEELHVSKAVELHTESVESVSQGRRMTNEE